MLSFSQVAEALMGLIYHRPSGENFSSANLSPLLFLIYVYDMTYPTHHQTNKSQFADDAGKWAVNKNIDSAAEYLQRDHDKLARWCAKWRIKLNPEKKQSQYSPSPQLQ